jgi:hypothetical protein
MRTQAESTKLRVVYDASARENPQEPSLNVCLHAKPVSKPRPGNLPVDRTEGDRPFQVVGVDFEDPIASLKSIASLKRRKERHI